MQVLRSFLLSSSPPEGRVSTMLALAAYSILASISFLSIKVQRRGPVNYEFELFHSYRYSLVKRALCPSPAPPPLLPRRTTSRLSDLSPQHANSGRICSI